MSEYIKIDHIDQLYAMPEFRQRAFRDEVRKYMAGHPFRHIDTEWGCFEGVDLNHEEAVKKAVEMVKEMTLEQKVNQMSGDYTPAESEYGFERYNATPFFAGEDLELNIPGIKFTDGPSGVVMGYHSTAFPVSMARAASFDRELEEKIGEVIGIESRSGGANLFAGVCINLLRHPGWGRAQETYGEDPYLLGEMGSALVKGVQKHVMACVEHFAANSIENARFKVDVRMDERALREVYFPHFKKCIDAGAAAVMSAYNRFRGEWCGHNKYLLRDILKDEWGFQGFVMSDFGYGIRGTVEPANAGMDLEMNNTQFFGKRLVEAVEEGLVDERVVDEAAVRLLAKKIEFAGVGNPALYGENQMASKEHVDLARKSAEESIVLLKNDSLLPLNRETTKKILVVGDLAKLGAIGDSKGSSAVFPPYVVDAYTGLCSAAPMIKFDFIRGVVADEVRQRSKQYDAVIVYAGLTYLDEGEFFADSNSTQVGGDRTDLGMSSLHWNMIEAACEGNKNTIVVLQGGSAIEMESFKDMPGAIIMQWYAGMEGGTALAEIIFGDVNPSGKLPVSIYARKQQLPYFDTDLSEIVYDFYHGYFAADKYHYDVTYPFGYGLSYTTFKYSDLRVSQSSENGEIEIAVNVQNTGNYDGTEIVQMYVGYENSLVERHVKDLKDFKRVSIKQGDSSDVYFKIKAEDLAYYDEKTHDWIIEDINYIVYVGSSSDINDLMKIKVHF
ncbi:MAG: glycoside hydrolase family 3 C-terminal domain-containing protein [Lachnospiraceae bacterium]|nr:glycoside hydrolase family 3 C-terminal domain-containing protein [Lachnospiraceae bacterium]